MKEFLEKCGVFFTSPLFAIGSFQVVVWHVAAVVALLLVVIIIICSAAKKRKNKLEVVEGEIVSATTATEEVASEPAVEPAPAEQQPAAPVVEEQPAAPVVEEETSPAPAPVQEEPAAPSQDVTIVEVEEEGDWEADATTEETAPAAEEATPSQPDKPRVKCYHISLREDGRWQVKLSKGARALKLFRTQAEAIAFAKEKAKNQEGYITIHKVSGKIRKQKY